MPTPKGTTKGNPHTARKAAPHPARHVNRGSAYPTYPPPVEDFVDEDDEFEDDEFEDDTDGFGAEVAAEMIDEGLAAMEGTLARRGLLPPVVEVEEYTADDYLADELVPMPSGKGLRLRRLSLISLVRTEQVPPNLLATARALLQMDEATGDDEAPRTRPTTPVRPGKHGQLRGQPGQPQRPQRPQATAKQTTNEDAFTLMDWVVCQSVCSFAVVDKLQKECAPGEVSITRIADPDKTAIFNYILKGQRALADFRSPS